MSRRAAATAIFWTVVVLAWTPLQAANHLLFKGLNVSDNCLEAAVPAPPRGPIPARNHVLVCAAIPYADDDTLVYSIADGRCETLERFSAEMVNDPGAVYVPNTSQDGSLEAVSEGLFLENPQAFLQLNAHTSELTEIGTMVCAPTGPGPPPDPDVLAQLDYLKAENAGAGDNFGDQVAVSGDTIVIGARLEDGSATVVNGPDDDLSSNRGAAYVYVRNGASANWVQQAYLKGTNLNSGDNFGSDVGIDGDTVVVAADQADDPSGSGAVYVFVRDGITWTQQALLKASDATISARFGRDVAISGDTIVVGTFTEDKAYVFERDPMTGDWTETHILTGSNTESGDSFGRDVAIDGDTIVVGAFAEDSDATGVNGDEDNNNTFRAGAAYVFVRDGEDWTQEAYLKASNPDVEDQFGGELSLSGDTLVVGVYHESSDATGINGFQFNNFRPDSGAAYVFVRDAGAWSQQAYVKASNTDSFDNFGASVWISGDRMAIGAPREASGNEEDQTDNTLDDSGAVYAFVRDGVTWSQTGYLKASNLGEDDWFGRDVGLSGPILIAGGFWEDSGIVNDETDNSATDAGAGYVFNVPGNDDPGGGTGDCTPDDITLSSQAEVDSFQAGHGPCDRVVGQLVISGADITNLDGLSNLTAVGWLQLTSNPLLDDLLGLSSVTDLSVIDLFTNFSLTSVDGLGGDTTPGSITLWDNPLLGDLDAFSGVTELEGSLNLRGSNVLQNLDAFSNLTRVVGIVNIIDNAQLQSVAGLANLTDFAGTWYVRDNPQLASLEGIGGQPDLTGLVIWNNDALTHIDELTGLQSVGNLYSELVIRDNENLQHLGGLADLVGVNAGLDLRDNPSLDDCSALQTLLDDVDDASPGPGPGGAGIPDLNGDVNISNNLAGCNSLGEILVGPDTEPPVVTAPPDIETPAAGVLTVVDLGNASATDNSGTIASLVNDAPVDGFPVGETIVTWTATDPSGNSGTDTQIVTITPPEILVPSTRREPTIDGDLSLGEWDDATTFDFQNGFAAFVHDDDRLYILIDMLGDDGNDPFSNGGGDQFWLHFDIDEDGAITPDVDLRFRLESGTGNMRLQTYCDGCPFDFNPLESQTLSARGEGFGCFIDDGSVNFFPLQCDSHRVWELAIDLAEAGMREDQTARFGMLVASGAPLFSENMPSNLNDLSNYGLLTLEESPRQLGSSPGAMDPLFEVTQAIQTENNALDLVAGKRTALRVWDEGNEEAIKIFAYGSRNGIDLPGSPLLDISSLYYESQDISRDSIVWNSFTVLPQGWSQAGTVDFEILVQGLDDVEVATRNSSISFAPTRMPVFWTVPIRNNFSESMFEEASAARMTEAEEWLRLAAPIEDMTFVRKPVLNVDNITSSAALKEVLKNYDSLTALAWVLGLINSGSPPFALPEQTTGFTASPFGDTLGSSDPVWWSSGDGRITWVAEADSGVDMGYAHEINHNLDRDPDGSWGRHVDGCDAPGEDPDWPYGGSFTIQETGVSPRNDGGFGSVSAGIPDYMSYCISGAWGVNQWWSPYRWAAWVDEFRETLPFTGGGVHGPDPVPEDSFYIQGRVYPDMSGEFTQVLRQPGVPETPNPGDPYTVRILDCGDVVLEETSFAAVFEDVEGQPLDFVSFTMTMAAPAASCSIELALDDTVLDTITISANAPTVQVLSPNGGEFWAGEEIVQWSASDADGDSLKFTLLLSADGGMTWQPVAGMIEDMEYEIDSSQWPESDEALIRVIASDGANTSFDDSDAPFIMVGKAPEVQIRFPAEGSIVSSIHEQTLSGLARLPTGELAQPENLMWSVDGMPFGLGASVPIFFAEGAHEITLELLDGDQVTASDTINMFAGDAPGTIGFSEALFTTSEGEGAVVLTVQRDGGATGPATVLFHTMDGSAVSGGDPAQGEDDYVAVPEMIENRLEWPDGDSAPQQIIIQINPDAVTEGDETFEVNLTAFDDEQLDISTATVVISSEIMEVIFTDGFETAPP